MDPFPRRKRPNPTPPQIHSGTQGEKTHGPPTPGLGNCLAQESGQVQA